MKKKSNEDGYAMLMVLMLVLLFTVLGMGLLAMNMNAAKQFNKKEEQVQARHQAEMGLLHYHADLVNKVKNYSFTKNSGESNGNSIKRSRYELCEKIKSVSAAPDSASAVKYVVNTLSVSGCNSTTSNEKIIVSVNSKGIVNKTEKDVKGTISLQPPVVTDTTGIPVKPVKPPGIPITDQNQMPNIGNYYQHVEVNGTFTTKKEQHHFESFVINMENKNDAALKVGGGSKDIIKVEKDFYIGGRIESQNQVCIYVKGNLTVLGSTYLGNKSVIVVYGDASFKSIVEIQNNNAGIYVVGNTYVDNKRVLTDEFRKFNVQNSDCSLPPSWDNPSNVVPSTTRYYWETNEELNPEYL